jgi:hypothetical protein
MALNIDLEGFKRDGYTVVKNVFTAAEVEDLRKRCYQTIRHYEPLGLVEYLPPWKKKKAASPIGDLLSRPLLTDLVLDERLCTIAATLLETDRATYFGDGNFNIGEGPMGFHKDSVDRTETGPDFEITNPPYNILRMGVYLQDHISHGGGLKVRQGSHRMPGHDKGPVRFVENTAGDVVVWYLTTTHSGNVVRLKFARNWSLPSIIEKRVPAFLKVPDEKERVAAFITYGVPGPHLERYLRDYINGRASYKKYMLNSPLTAEMQTKIEAASGRLHLLKPMPEYGLSPEQQQALDTVG